jgi:hypothetical protein
MQRGAAPAVVTRHSQCAAFASFFSQTALLPLPPAFVATVVSNWA